MLSMKRALLASFVFVMAGGAAGGAAACSSSGGGGAPSADGGPDGTTVEAGEGGVAVSFTPVNPCTDSIDSIYADPGDVSGFAKGDIIKCAHDADYTAAALLATAKVPAGPGIGSWPADAGDAGTPPYSGKDFTSGAHVYRVLYRTERGDANSSPGYSSATVFIPDTPRKGATTALPIVLAAHGSRGQAGRCAPSKADPAAYEVNADFIHLVYPFVGFGFPVIAPDLAGYANYGAARNPPSAYDAVNDVGKSNLDGARALRKLIPAGLTDKIIITGHSQGGYTALDTLTLSDSYGVDGTIAAVAVYTPLWVSQRAFGAIFNLPDSYGSMALNPNNVAVAIWYHYTHSELLDGPGHGIDLFQPSKQALIKSFVDNDCWSPQYPELLDAGASANDFFLPSYVSAIELPATPLGGGNCNGNALCQTWIDRMTADYPHITGNDAQIPILLWYGNGDGTIPPVLAQCIFNRLSSDNANYKVCYDPDPAAGHSGPPAVDNNYVVDWVAQQALGDPAPTEPCQAIPPNDAGVPQLVDQEGGAVQCYPLISTQ
jgi:pimeloyl-ACP methyl ester carboxylesterase